MLEITHRPIHNSDGINKPLVARTRAENNRNGMFEHGATNGPEEIALINSYDERYEGYYDAWSSNEEFIKAAHPHQCKTHRFVTSRRPQF